jgi:hypothetical protein
VTKVVGVRVPPPAPGARSVCFEIPEEPWSCGTEAGSPNMRIRIRATSLAKP